MLLSNFCLQTSVTTKNSPWPVLRRELYPGSVQGNAGLDENDAQDRLSHVTIQRMRMQHQGTFPDVMQFGSRDVA